MSPETAEALEAARAEVDRAIREYIRIFRSEQYPDDPPYVQGWIVGTEWTNVEFERDNAGGRDLIAPSGQMLSIGAGLGAWLKSRYT